MDVLKVILFLIGFCFLLYLTYVTTRFVGGKQIRAMKGKSISVIETLSLGMDKRIHLIKAGKQHILIATTSKTVELLTTVNIDDPIPDEEISSENTVLFDFKSIFEKYAGTYKTKKESSVANQVDEMPKIVHENRNFKSNLGRLRTIIQNKQNQSIENGDEGTNEE